MKSETISTVVLVIMTFVLGLLVANSFGQELQMQEAQDAIYQSQYQQN